jgi:hypothetical protein
MICIRKKRKSCLIEVLQSLPPSLGTGFEYMQDPSLDPALLHVEWWVLNLVNLHETVDWLCIKLNNYEKKRRRNN